MKLIMVMVMKISRVRIMVIVKCDVVVKDIGIRLRKLVNMMNMKSVMMYGKNFIVFLLVMFLIIL